MTVPPDAFRNWIAPHVRAIRDFAGAIEAVSQRHADLPSVASRAMRERAEEQPYRGRSAWEQPVADAHMFGAMTLRAATDYVRGFGELFDSDHPPLYAHLTLARAALESAVVCAWLSQVDITSDERMKRGLCELVYSANEVTALKLDTAGPERVAFWAGVAADLGWKLDNRRLKPIIDQTRRPRISDGVVRLIGAEGDSRVGNLLYSRLSAVDHVTWFGLFSAMDPQSAERDERARTARVPIMVDGAAVAGYAYYVIKAVRGAAHERFTLMGWVDNEWHAAAVAAETLESQLLTIAASSSRFPPVQP